MYVKSTYNYHISRKYSFLRSAVLKTNVYAFMFIFSPFTQLFKSLK